MDFRLEVVVVPVSDVDRGKACDIAAAHAELAFFRDPDGNAWAVQQIPARE